MGSNPYTHRSSNIAKTWFLMFFMLALLGVIGWFLAQYYGNPNFLYIAFGIALVMNITGYWFSDKIALSVSKAYPVDGPQYTELHRIVENLAITAGLPKPRVYVIPDMAPNAFATGRNPKNAAVAVTEGLLQMLDRSELEGVIAHELAHIGNRDILIATVAVVLAGVFSLLADFFFHFGVGGRREGNGGGGIFAIVGLVLVILAPIAATMIRLAISRKREFLADATGALITRYPEGLASALRKIASYGAPMKHAHDATAHMFIANPFGAQKLKSLHKLFMTHPPVEERIQALLGQKI